MSVNNGIFYHYGAQGLTEVGAILEICSISKGINPFLIGLAALILLLTRKLRYFLEKKSNY